MAPNFNPNKQHTLNKSATISGTGLHSGILADMTLTPADPGYGIYFQRIDLVEKPLIKADCDLVSDVSRGTTLETNGVKQPSCQAQRSLEMLPPNTKAEIKILVSMTTRGQKLMTDAPNPRQYFGVCTRRKLLSPLGIFSPLEIMCEPFRGEILIVVVVINLANEPQCVGCCARNVYHHER